ncbi:AbrB/MazE/SpoVT family DNA-binding domain-containing protein [Sphingobium algorifonticola]|uniref:AbrB/MazE/SpoVT family DNA-binding domain-containing protein n=1 Tax=Sphingobium algorifonticola TaxID=2008318 RepID=A0A437J8L3_9SPHN|nr:AbrB/MazE/SpoVT family DNA-binding domain-containing protein [Sphingobium algorifonticola]RVT41828.1 AbrB/MazE/SpoVT family DNA-binding domain-containing protein [Sphingobium algorifonticola]
MNAQTKVSGKGQVVIPKETRDRYGIDAGSVLDVIEMSDGFFLRPHRSKKSGRSFDEIMADIRSIYQHQGPPVSIEDMNASIDEMFRNRDRSSDI